ncbi:hypothetical protein ES319_D11G134500v1 [Gossypium barbadense]|uniref:Uncharacterized protein n=2 Tax=Gossypium TaxID=3633 RepID=A0A5J5PAH2_GOSBA|nr:hypothetical protein ES319_D11G134500v1 [Gossypium barbadense]TYH43624.1 hypothetical protein ES332_D11G139400v1 [Gossypium tomentosum]
MLGACSSYGESRGTRRVLAWPCNDSHCRARILQAEVTKKLMNLLEDINDWISLVHATGNGAMPAVSFRKF